MNRALTAVAVAVVAVFASPAAARAQTMIVSPDANDQAMFQRLVEKSKVPTAEGTITTQYGDCGGALGCYNRFETRDYRGIELRLEIRISESARELLTLSPQEFAMNFYHELGHHFDASARQSVRDEFARIMKRPFDAEKFADAYGFCALFGTKLPRDWNIGISGSGYYPIRRRHQSICRLIRRAAL